jgi:hypothetical protein
MAMLENARDRKRCGMIAQRLTSGTPIDAGVAVTSAKGIYYEWVRDLATHQRPRA